MVHQERYQIGTLANENVAQLHVDGWMKIDIHSGFLLQKIQGFMHSIMARNSSYGIIRTTAHVWNVKKTPINQHL